MHKPGHQTSEFYLTLAIVGLAGMAWGHFAHAGVRPDTALPHCGLLGLVSTLAALAVRRYLDVRVYLKSHLEEETGPREPAREFGFGRFSTPDDLDDDFEDD